MNLRAAKFNDFWRTAFARKYPQRVQSIALTDAKAVADSHLIFPAGIVALVGGNGVGKSTFAHAIAEGLFDTSTTPDLTTQHARISGSRIKFALTKNGVSFSRQVSFEASDRGIDGAETLTCNWLDPSLFATKCRQQVHGDEAFEEILDGVTPLDLSDEELALASYIVGKQYIRCQVWEISEYGPFDLWPYFRVATRGANYSSESMGQGELALLSAIWAINRYPDNSVVILEEPETHVSSRSQSSFMDFLAKGCAERGLSFVVTTHSSTILQKIPMDHLFLIVSNGQKSEVIPSPRFHQVAALVGGGVAYRSLVVVEDEAAKALCEAILEFADPDLARQVIYSVARDGESEIVRILKAMPPVAGWGKLVGCFDGDQRQRHAALALPWPHIFLPSEQAPDRLLRDWLLGLDTTDAASNLSVDHNDLVVALAVADGIDHHDWFRTVAQNLHQEVLVLVKAAAKLWIRDNEALAKQFAGELKNSMS
ncbi:AAA family ATPase [Caballeronia sp. LZ028]|uniref:ATP-dependent nuclease n=1 Tax=Caballeronia sp. LZ028 TaxID=3038563 RepID=UPI0028559443|nr:AAA family ATPase [Caballeronia sp. LZ028]MDR5769725.1 AAA family ATPase [Caballeronia sp. LZ028]